MSGKYTEFKFGWPVVAASAVGIGLGLSPLPFYTIGVFIGPLMNEFGWKIGQIQSAFVILTVVVLFMGPLIGQITSRFGVRKVVLASIFLFSLTMMSFALVDGSITMFLVIWFFLGVFGAGTLPITWTRAVTGWFFEKRGLALGMSLIGTGIFGLLSKQYAFYLIEAFGWRWAYVGVGALPLVLAFPLAWFFLRDVTDPKVAHKVQQMKQQTNVDHAAQGGLTLGQAFKDWRFWLLAYSFVPISFAVGGPIPNLEVMMGAKGFTSVEAVQIASVIGIAVVVGRVAGGFLLDHFWAPAVAAIILSLPALASFGLAQPEISYWTAMSAVFVLGLAAGVEYDLMAYLVSRYFGLLHYAAIYGALYGFFALGAGVGPKVFGDVYDSTGSYDTILKISGVLFVAGAVPLLLLGKYRDYTVVADENSD